MAPMVGDRDVSDDFLTDGASKHRLWRRSHETTDGTAGTGARPSPSGIPAIVSYLIALRTFLAGDWAAAYAPKKT